MELPTKSCRKPCLNDNKNLELTFLVFYKIGLSKLDLDLSSLFIDFLLMNYKQVLTHLLTIVFFIFSKYTSNTPFIKILFL